MKNTSFPIKIQEKLPLKKIKEGLFLFMYRATRIPPHLGIIYNGKMYDITLLGPNLGIDASEFLSTIVKKYTKTIFFEIQLAKTIDNIRLEPLLIEKMKQFNNVSESTSCIAPLKLFFEAAYQINTTHVDFIFDLIPLLIKNRLIINTYHLNLERNMSENEFLLKIYNKEDIINCIQSLNRKKIIC